MKKRSIRKTKATPAVRKVDAQIAEFEARDLGDDLRASGQGRVIRPRATPTSILLDAELIRRLREKGKKRGLGYQTMLKLVVLEHLDEY